VNDADVFVPLTPEYGGIKVTRGAHQSGLIPSATVADSSPLLWIRTLLIMRHQNHSMLMAAVK